MRLKADAFILTLDRLYLPLTAAVSGLSLREVLDKFPSRCRIIALLELIKRLLIDLMIKRRIILTDKLLLNLLQHFLLPFLQSLHVSIGCNFDDLLNLIHKTIEVHHLHLIIDPVSLPLMQGLDDLMELFVLSLAVVLDQLDQVAVLEVTTHPVFLLTVLQDAVALEYVVFELAHVEVTIFEHFFAHAIQLSIYVVASLDQPQLKLVLVSVGVWVVAAVRAPEDEVEPQSINEAIFLEAYDYSVSLLLHFHQWNLLKLVPYDLRMRGSNQKVQLSEIKHPIKHSKVILL